MPRFLGYSFYRCFRTVDYTPRMLGKLRAFLRDETAATAIEYGLIAAGIAVVIIPVMKGLGSKLNSTFTSISSSLK
jgi:pilus assembly protein Flp/PilA